MPGSPSAAPKPLSEVLAEPDIKELRERVLDPEAEWLSEDEWTTLKTALEGADGGETEFSDLEALEKNWKATLDEDDENIDEAEFERLMEKYGLTLDKIMSGGDD